MITDRRNPFPWAIRRVQVNILSTFSATSDFRDLVNYVRRCSCLATDMEEKQTELESESK